LHRPLEQAVARTTTVQAVHLTTQRQDHTRIPPHPDNNDFARQGDRRKSERRDTRSSGRRVMAGNGASCAGRERRKLRGQGRAQVARVREAQVAQRHGRQRKHSSKSKLKGTEQQGLVSGCPVQSERIQIQTRLYADMARWTADGKRQSSTRKCLPLLWAGTPVQHAGHVCVGTIQQLSA
jgi:hypothetical protein